MFAEREESMKVQALVLMLRGMAGVV